MISETNGLALSIGILAGISVPVAGWLGMPVWLLFLGWLTYFFCGRGVSGLRLQVATNLFGILLGVVALGVLALLSAPPWATSVILVVAAFVIVQSGRLPWLSQTPGSFIGLAMIAAAVQVSGRTVLEPSWANPIILAVGAALLGSVFASASELGCKGLSGQVRDRAPATEKA